jgi:RND family efflux transporter MFP subunit
VAQVQAEADQAKAAVKVADAKVTTAQALVAETAAMMTSATANYDKAKSEYNRFVQLAANSAVTQKLVDETKEQLTAAEAGRQRATAHEQSAQAAVEEAKAILEKANADVKASEARIQVAVADHDRSSAILQYGTIRAPYDGVVSRRNVHTGHLVTGSGQGEPLLVVVRTDRVRVFLDVPEGDAGLVDPDDEAVIRVPALGNREFRGRVKRTSWSLNETARTLRAEVDVPDEDGKLRPGMYAYANVLAAEHTDALVLPASAVASDKGASYCFVVEEGKIARNPVTLGLRSGGEVEVASGLTGNEKVVRGNLSAYTLGQAVEAVPYVAPK